MNNILNNCISISIKSPTLKKGKNDVRFFDAQLHVVDGLRTYILAETKRDVERKRFDLIPGSIITDQTGSYTCHQIKYMPIVHRIVPVILAS